MDKVFCTWQFSHVSILYFIFLHVKIKTKTNGANLKYVKQYINLNRGLPVSLNKKLLQ